LPVVTFVVFNLVLSGGENMSHIADIGAISTFIIAVGFSLWMLKELFTGR
jgi:fibrillarin-like rRNA methylase